MNLRFRSVASLLAILVFTIPVISQQKMRAVDENKFKKGNEPVATSYAIGDSDFVRKDHTLAGPDWLDDLVVNVRSQSQKTFVGFHIALVIEQQGTMPSRNVLDLTFPGPKQPVLDTDGNPTGIYKAQVLGPSETVKVKKEKWGGGPG